MQRKTKRRYKKRRRKGKKIKIFIFYFFVCVICAFIVANVMVRHIEIIGIDIKKGTDTKISVPYKKINKHGKTVRSGVLNATIKSDGSIDGRTEEKFNIYGDSGRRKITGRPHKKFTIEGR